MLYPADLEGCLRDAGLSIHSLQDDRAIIYVLDEVWRIAFCNWAWDRFASLNGAVGLTHLRVVGESAMDVTPPPLRGLYENAYRTARKTGKPWEHDFECSSPETFRLFHMRILPIEGPYLIVENSLRVETHHEPPPQGIEFQTSNFVSREGFIVMCCHCRRTREAGNMHSPAWVWIPSFLNMPPGEVSHGLCDMCRRFFYGSVTAMFEDSNSQRLEE